MKKIILGAVALLAVASFTSCDKKGEKSTSTNDSLATAYGEYVGSMINTDFSGMGEKTKADKQEFVRGMQIVFGAEASENNMLGMQVALQMLRELDGLEKQGLEVNKAAVMNAFKQSFLNDSIGSVDVTRATVEFRRLYEEATTAAQAKAAEEKAQAPDAVENGNKGDKAIADLKAQNPNAKVTDSGLAYVIENEGTAPKPDENATVVVNYTGKHLDGEVFDSTDGRGPATFNLQGVVPGFREGLMLIGKGGKATLYIPGKLAYGVNGNPNGGIGPNEMLVFEVELLDVNPE